MKKLAVIALISLSITEPSFAMEIKSYPRTLDELEYCVKAQMNKDIAIPDGCKTIGQRIYDKYKSKM